MLTPRNWTEQPANPSPPVPRRYRASGQDGSQNPCGEKPWQEAEDYTEEYGLDVREPAATMDASTRSSAPTRCHRGMGP
jgi:hypothetical protein